MNVFTLAAKLTLDSSEYDKGLSKAESGMSKLGSALKTGLSTAAKVGTAAITAASGAIAALVKKSVEGYAEYEQLVGGVETLFGNSAATIQRYANEAYKTAGLSANEYMETVTSFSASLLQSLGGDTLQASYYADQAIRDMSDNANKMGSSMESIQNAYQGFAKQNYTMLDNLKLGYGGTKTEMERLITDAEGLNSAFKATRDENGDLAMSFSDIVQAIHIVQDEMGITGTTAKEASETIQGSLSSLKAAWQNLVTGFGNKDADLGGLIDDVVQSATTALGNVIPVASRAVRGIASSVREMAPVIAAELPGLISDIMPDLLLAGKELLVGIGKGLIQSVPALVQTAKTIVNSVLDEIGIGDTVREFFGKIEGPVSEAWDKIKTSVSDAFERIKEAISPVTDAIGEWIESGQAMEDTTNFVSTAVGLLADGISFVADGIATVVEKGREFIDWLNGGTAGAEAFKTVVLAVVAALTAYKTVSLALEAAEKARLIITKAVTAAQELMNAVMSANPIGLIIAAVAALVAAFIYLWKNCEEFREFWIGLWAGIKEAFSAVVSFIGSAFASIAEWAAQAWEGIKEAFSVVGEWFTEKFTAAKEAVTNAWSNIKEKMGERWEEIKSAFSAVGEWFSEKFSEAKDNAVNAWNNIKEKATEIWNLFKEGFTFSDALQWGRDMIQNFISGITEKWENLKESLRNIGQSIKDFIGFSEPKIGPLSDFHTYAPDMMELFAKGIRDNEHVVTDQIAKSFDFADMEMNPSINSGGAGGAGAASGRFTIGFDPDPSGLVRYLHPYIKEEDARVGGVMVVG